MSAGLYSGVSGLALGTGLYKGAQGLWAGASGLVNEFGASLALDFLAGAPLDSRITFSRTTNATLVDATGRVTYAPNNLLIRSEEFDDAAWSKTNSTIAANVTTAPNGTLTADKHIPNNGATIGTGATETRVQRSPTVTLGVNYVFSIYAKAGEYDRLEVAVITTPSSTAVFSLTSGTVVSGTGATITPVGGGWYRCAIVVTASATGALALRWSAKSSTVSVGDGVSGIFAWGAQFEEVTYQTLPSTYVQTVASVYYGPRFDYDPVTLAPRGLLIEEQRTNLFTYSEQFDNAGWVKGNSTVTANATTSPDGTANADKLVENTATGAHQITQQTAFVSGTSYTWSFYVKAAERSVARVLFPAAAFTSNLTANFDLATGAWRTGSPTPSPALTLASQNAGNGWYRISATATATASLNQTILLLMVDTPSGTGNYTGNGTSGLFIWGAQLEVGSFATSYIPTVASTVTRAADDASMTGTNFSSWYNQSEGTIVSDFGPFFRTSGNPGVAQIDDGSANNTVRIFAGTVVSPVFNVVTGGGSSQAFLNAGIINPNANTSIAGAYALDNFAKSANGNTPDTDASGTVPVVNRMLIGSGTAGVNYLNGYMRSITFYPQRLANAQLQALTS